MITSSRIKSHTDLNRSDETRDNITVEGGDLLVNENNIDRQTHTHHQNKILSKTVKVEIFPYNAYQMTLFPEMSMSFPPALSLFSKKKSQNFWIWKNLTLYEKRVVFEKKTFSSF